MSRSILLALIVAGLALGPDLAREAHAQDTVELPLVQFGSLRETLRGATRDSGNTAFGDLFSGLIALDVATAPLGAPAAGIVYRFEDVPDRPRLQTLNFVPLVLGRAATIGGSTATFGLNVVSARYDTASDFPLEALPVATFQGPAPIVTSSALDLSVDTLMMTGFATFGLTDNLDVGVAVPFVGVTLRGSMVQQEAAIGTAIFPLDASSFGLGDIGGHGAVSPLERLQYRGRPLRSCHAPGSDGERRPAAGHRHVANDVRGDRVEGFWPTSGARHGGIRVLE